MVTGDDFIVVTGNAGFSVCVCNCSNCADDRDRVCCFLICPVHFMVITLLGQVGKAYAYTHTDCHKIDT